MTPGDRQDRDPDPQLERMLGGAREGPSAERLAHMEQKLGPVFDAVDGSAPGPTEGTSPSQPPAAGTTATGGAPTGLSLGKLGVLTAVLAASIGGAAWWFTSRPAPNETPAPNEAPGKPEPAKPPPAEPSSPSEAAKDTVPSPKSANAGESAQPTANESEDPGPSTTAGKRARDRASPKPKAVPSSPTRVKGSGGLSEAELVARARDAVDADPAHALELTETHRERFAEGMLVQERELVAIEALMELDRNAAAQQRAKAFLQKHTGSAHAEAVRRMLQSLERNP